MTGKQVMDDDRWRRAHEAARRLHDALLALGLPESELTALTARPDSAGDPRIYIPALAPASIDRILTALGTYLGPAWAASREGIVTTSRGAGREPR